MKVNRMAILGVLAACLALPAWMTAVSQGTQEQAATPAGQEIIQRERAMWQAIKSKDRATLDGMIGPTAMFVNPQGVENKWQFLQSLPNLSLQDATISNVQVRMPGADSRVVTYQMTQYGTLAGQPLPRTAWVTSVWYRLNGQWALVSRQMTPVG